MAVPFWVGIYTDPSAKAAGYIFQAPDYKTALAEADGANSLLMFGGPWSTYAAAAAAAKKADVTIQGAPGTPSPPSGGTGGGSGGGNLDKHTILTVTQWVVNQIGHCYAWSGAMGPDLRGCPDCSSFCNAAWGVVGGQAIPGFAAGTYDGSEHGPSTVGWLASQGTVTGSIDRSLASAGDLAVWQTHMGFCISNDQMVSAQNEADGVRQSGIDGFISGETLTILRLSVIGPGGISFPVPGVQDSHQIDAVIRQIAEASRLLVGTRMRLGNVSRPGGRA